jgi:hypothetical protein
MRQQRCYYVAERFTKYVRKLVAVLGVDATALSGSPRLLLSVNGPTPEW